MIWLPTVWTGLNAAIGSCGISAIWPPRMSRISAPFGSSFARSTVCGRAVLGGAPEQHLAADDAAGRLDDAEQRLHGHALAAAALADDAEDLAGVDVQRDAVDRLDHPFVHEEVDLEVSN